MKSQWVRELRPAGSDLLAIQMFSDRDREKGIYPSLSLLLKKHGTFQNVLIIGGRCGLTAEIISPFSSKVCIVEEEPFFSLLQTRFLQRKDIRYHFGEEGLLSKEILLPKPIVNNTQLQIVEAHKFEGNKMESFDIIILERIIFDHTINVVNEITKIQHKNLITLISDGRIMNTSTKNLWWKALNHLHQHYTMIDSHKIQAIRHITKRRKEIIYINFMYLQHKIHEQAKHHSLEQIYKKNQVANENPYQTKELVEMYKEFHYGNAEYFSVKNYPKACAQICIQLARKFEVKGRALDIGCAVGRSTIQLAEHFEEVVGIDFSQAFIDSANECLKDYPKETSKRVQFFVGDACKMDVKLGRFNLIFGGNLIDRLRDPKAFLMHVNEFLEPKGILILSSPYSWLQEYTPIENWIGGYIKNNEPVTTLRGLETILNEKGLYQIETNKDVQFIIKENDFSYQSTLANMTFWIKR